MICLNCKSNHDKVKWNPNQISWFKLNRDLDLPITDIYTLLVTRHTICFSPAGYVETVMRCDGLSSPLWSLTPFSAWTTNVYDWPGRKPAINTLWQTDRNKHPCSWLQSLAQLHAILIRQQISLNARLKISTSHDTVKQIKQLYSTNNKLLIIIIILLLPWGAK